MNSMHRNEYPHYYNSYGQASTVSRAHSVQPTKTEHNQISIGNLDDIKTHFPGSGYDDKKSFSENIIQICEDPAKLSTSKTFTLKNFHYEGDAKKPFILPKMFELDSAMIWSGNFSFHDGSADVIGAGVQVTVLGKGIGYAIGKNCTVIADGGRSKGIACNNNTQVKATWGFVEKQKDVDAAIITPYLLNNTYKSAMRLWREPQEASSKLNKQYSNFIINDLIEAAKQKHPEASFQLGNIFLNGNCHIPKDYSKAKHYFETAQEQNYYDPNDQDLLEKLITEASNKESVAGLLTDSRSNDRAKASKALYELGRCHYQGKFGVSKDIKSAKTYFEQAQGKGSEDAAKMLDIILVEELQQRHEKRDSIATYELGMSLYEGRHGLSQNKKAAVTYFEMASDQKNAEASLQLGEIYLKDIEVKQSTELAASYFNIAVEQGHTLTKEQLEVTSNQKTISDLKSEIAKGNSQATYDLGMHYYKGTCGLTKDVKTAAMCFKMGSQQKSADAAYQLGMILLNGEDGFMKNTQETIRLFKSADEFGHVDAAYRLGVIYMDQSSVTNDADFKEGMQWYEKAAREGTYTSEASEAYNKCVKAIKAEEKTLKFPALNNVTPNSLEKFYSDL